MKKRPINLNLFNIRFSVMALVSISHRVSGVLIFLYLPLLLWCLNESLRSEASYEHLRFLLGQMQWKVLLIVFLWSLWFHVLAGLRHMIMDFGLGLSKNRARVSAWCLWVFFVLSAAAIGVKIWH
ncbi:MAG: succinate dehydrogenase, cytochrome b556 subunit [Gammaproteobacteria bacterium]